LVDNLKKPTESERKALSKLFALPSSSSGKHSSSSRQFDPLAKCCVSKQKKMKKAATTLGRPWKVEVVLLPDYFSVVPKGKGRKN